jgi:hypothetical protein
VAQVREQRKRPRLERVQPGEKHVGHLSLVHEHRELRLAHRELRPVLDLHVLHRIPVREHAVRVLRPVDDVDELLAEEAAKTHAALRLGGRGVHDTGRGRGVQ